MVIFLASWAMMFGALFFAYGVIRVRSSVWPPPDLPRLPTGLPLVGTAALALSSLAVQGAYALIRRARPRALAPLLASAAVLGAGFLTLQIVVWRGAYLDGLRPDGGPYASVFYGMTWFHGLHVAVGIVALFWLAARALMGAYSAARHVAVRLWALYWHMVGIVWVAMYVLVYLI
jgi:cytochrome c oxidase subunit 3